MSLATQLTAAFQRVALEIKNNKAEVGPAIDAKIVAATPAIQDMIDAAVEQRPMITRRITYGAGGQGNSVSPAQTFTQRGLRIPVQLPCDTTRWRFRAWNMPYTASLSAQATMTGKGMVIGDAEIPEQLFSGNFKAGATISTLISGDFTIPGTVPTGGDWYNSGIYFSPWFDQPAQQFLEGIPRILGTGVVLGSSASNLSMEQQALYFATATDGVDSSKVNPTNGPLPFSMVIEYETVTDKEVMVLFGDSIPTGIMGYKGSAQASYTPVPTFWNYPNRWAKDNNVIVQQVGFSGLAAVNFTTANTVPAQLFNKNDLVSPGFEIIGIALGSNDAASSQTVVNYQAAIKSIVDTIRPLADPDAELWYVNSTPRALGTTPESLRVTYNDWLSMLPYGAKGVIDMDGSFSNGTTGLKSSLSMDGIHWSFSGQARAATELERIRKAR